jgi:signal recognition particle subunit SRP72
VCNLRWRKQKGDGGEAITSDLADRPVLSLDPSSVPAFQTLLFLHLHTDEYASALALLDKPPTGSVSKLEFERAYCLYRLHREKEALEVLRTIGTQGRKEDHLEAQIVSICVMPERHTELTGVELSYGRLQAGTEAV